MKKKTVSAKEAIALIKNNKFNKNYTIDFKNEKIDVFNSILLSRNGIEVPEQLIIYDDDKIDYSDIPEITDNDILTGKLIPTIVAEIPLENDIREWIRKENINISEFTARLIRNFYESIKSLPKNVAL